MTETRANRFGGRWVTAVLILALEFAGCATQGTAGQASPVSFQGTVVDAQSGVPIEGVTVVLCAEAAERPIAFENVLSPCATELASTFTDRSGSFRMARDPGDQIPPGANIVFRSAGYLPLALPPATLRSGGGSSNRVTLRSAPTVEVTVVNADGAPVRNAGLGWFVEEKAGAIRARYQACCSSAEGRISFGLDGVPEGRVTLFSTTGSQTPRFGTNTIATHSGGRYSVILRVAQPLQQLRGRVVDVDGSPLAAVVSVEPAEANALTGLDRVLLEVRGTDTDLAGNFEFRIASPARVVLHLSTWVGLATGAAHVRLTPLAEVASQFGLDPKPVILKAAAVPVVCCTMLGPNNARLAVAELGLFFAPHRTYGHSGSCVWVGGPAGADEDSQRTFPQEVRFIWPSGSETLVVTARSTAVVPGAKDASESQSFSGEVALKRPADACQIRGM